jgi:chemotaxis protein MotB
MPMRRFSFLPPAENGGPPDWAITFADMMTLILIFFVLLASFSNTDAAKYRALVGSLNKAFGSKAAAADSSVVDSLAAAARTPKTRAEARQVEEELRRLAQENRGRGELEVSPSPEGVRLRVEGRILFPLGSATLNEAAMPFLHRLTPILGRYPYRILVEGHTDDLPIASTVYPSNWELSAARAGNVVRHLISEGGIRPDQLAAVGYADTRPVAPNTDEVNRGRNRRVEFLLSQLPLPSQ